MRGGHSIVCQSAHFVARCTDISPAFNGSKCAAVVESVWSALFICAALCATVDGAQWTAFRATQFTINRAPFITAKHDPLLSAALHPTLHVSKYPASVIPSRSVECNPFDTAVVTADIGTKYAALESAVASAQ